jgi:4-diphosphocytidyl-2-C-methyl-D-erythritol kinase
MVVFPNAKINLGLNIIERRADGYHNIESCFVPIEWVDVLEAVEQKTFAFTSSGLNIPGDPSNNLAVLAFKRLQQVYDLPNVAIHLHKNIPIGAGLGGGSADGAFMIKLLNEKFHLKLSDLQMEAYASELGSDCAFFIQNRPRYVEGTGTKFSDIKVSLKGKFIIIAYPNLHVSTSEAYGGVTPKPSVVNLKDSLENNAFSSWQGLIVNDFEPGVSKIYPAITDLVNQFKQHGAIYTSMTGSGSAVYGLFDAETNIELAFPYYKYWA